MEIMSPVEADRLADELASKLFSVMLAKANQQYPWRGPITSPMECLGKQILDRALRKFYAKVG